MDTIKHTFFYRLPFFTSIALMAASIFAPAGKTVDIHVHDTYFIIAASHYYIINGILLLFIGTLVWVTRNLAWKTYLTWAHLTLTCMTIILICFVPLFIQIQYIDISTSFIWHYNRLRGLNMFIVSSFLILMFSQCLFVLNVLIGIIKKQA